MIRFDCLPCVRCGSREILWTGDKVERLPALRWRTLKIRCGKCLRRRDCSELQRIVIFANGLEAGAMCQGNNTAVREVPIAEPEERARNGT